MLDEVDRREHPGEATSHDHDGRVFDQWVPGEAGVDEWVLVQFLSQLTPLGHAVCTDALLLLLPIALPQLVECGAFCAVVLLCHSRFFPSIGSESVIDAQNSAMHAVGAVRRDIGEQVCYLVWVYEFAGADVATNQVGVEMVGH